MTTQTTVESLVEKIKAGYPGIFLYSQEEYRTIAEIRAAAKLANRVMKVWTLEKGFTDVFGEPKAKYIPDTNDPQAALDYCAKAPAKEIIVLRSFHHFLDNALVLAKLTDILHDFKMKSCTLILLSAVMKIPKELEKDISMMEINLPDKEMMGNLLDSIVRATSEATKKPISEIGPTPEVRKQVIDASLGLTTTEAESAMSLSLVRGKKTGNQWDPKVVLSEKTLALRKSGLLQFIEVDESGMNNVGGMSNLKEWIGRRKKGFTEEARKFGLPPVKGLLMVGIPGTGKSLGARALSSELKLPLLRCDMGTLFGGLVGQSEENTRRAIATAEAIQPCIMWLDEIEKGFAGASNGLDSGVGARVLGTFLTWMQEKKSQVFVYATANDVSQLPPELLRKGRFDEIFSVSLPTLSERVEILRIHLKKVGREALIGKTLKLEHFADELKGFSGSEIEAVVYDSLWRAFDANREMSAADMETEIESSTPLSKTMPEKIKKMEDWCATRTRPAGVSEEPTQAVSTGVGGRVVSA